MTERYAAAGVRLVRPHQRKPPTPPLPNAAPVPLEGDQLLEGSNPGGNVGEGDWLESVDTECFHRE